MVGGRIIEITPVTVNISRLRCIDRNNDECAVHVEHADEMPSIGDEIWWQGKIVYWNNDKNQLTKIGYSYTPINRK